MWGVLIQCNKNSLLSPNGRLGVKVAWWHDSCQIGMIWGAIMPKIGMILAPLKSHFFSCGDRSNRCWEPKKLAFGHNLGLELVNFIIETTSGQHFSRSRTVASSRGLKTFKNVFPGKSYFFPGGLGACGAASLTGGAHRWQKGVFPEGLGACGAASLTGGAHRR